MSRAFQNDPLATALSALRRQDYPAVERHCNGVLAEEPAHPGATLLLAQAMAECGRRPEAIVIGRRASPAGLRESAAARDLLFSLARVLESAGAYGEAFAAAERANAMLRPP